jgi:hypothetical protein
MEQNQMSKFCIQLEGMMLPDAIAAVVEAWYDAQNVEAVTDWVDELRLQIKRNFGRGWIIRSVGGNKLNPNGKCQLTRIAADRTRNSVVLPVKWNQSNADLIYDWVSGICGSFLSSASNCSTLQDAFEMENIFQSKKNQVESKMTPANAI